MYEHDILQRKRYEYAPIAVPSGVRPKAVLIANLTACVEKSE